MNYKFVMNLVEFTVVSLSTFRITVTLKRERKVHKGTHKLFKMSYFLTCYILP